MRKELIRSAFLLVTVCVVVTQGKPAFAATAEEMLEYCEASLALADDAAGDPATVAMAARCTGLTQGVGTVLSYNCWSRGQGYSPMFVAEAPSSVGVAIQAFVDWVQANPDSRGEDATDVMIGALMGNFPCRE